MMQPGLYKARVVNKKTAWGLSKTSTGKTQFTLQVEIIEAADEDAEKIETADENGKPISPPLRTIFMYCSEKTWQRTLRELKKIGYPYPKLIPSALCPGNEAKGTEGSDDYRPGSFDFGGRVFEVKCEEDEYNGKPKERWSVFTPIGDAMSEEEMAQFESAFGQEPDKAGSFSLPS